MTTAGQRTWEMKDDRRSGTDMLFLPGCSVGPPATSVFHCSFILGEVNQFTCLWGNCSLEMKDVKQETDDVTKQRTHHCGCSLSPQTPPGQKTLLCQVLHLKTRLFLRPPSSDPMKPMGPASTLAVCRPLLPAPVRRYNQSVSRSEGGLTLHFNSSVVPHSE